MFLNTLRFRLVLWFLIIETAALLLFSVLLYSLMSRDLYSHHDQALLSAQSHFLSFLEFSSGSDLGGIKEMKLNFEGAVGVFSKDGSKLFETEGFKSISIDPASISFDEDEDKFLTFETESGQTVRILASRLSGGKYVVLHGSLLGDVKDTLKTLKLTLAIVIPLVLLSTSFGGYLIASKALLPVKEITRRAREIQAKNLDQRLDIPTSDIEFRNLVKTLNDMMERLNNAFLSMQQFIADASHELKTPLTIITGTLEVVLNRDRNPAEYKEAVHTVLDEMNRMSRMVNQLLLLSSFDSGRTGVYVTEVDLGDILQKSYELTAPIAEEKQIKMSLLLNGQARVLADPAQIAQVLINLIDNSLKYTPPNGRIELSADSKDTHGVITITDSGIGIPPSELPFIFERFYQVDKSRSGDNRGIGLGLSIVKKIVEAHRGTVSVESKEGQGTTLRIFLPLAGRAEH